MIGSHRLTFFRASENAYATMTNMIKKHWLRWLACCALLLGLPVVFLPAILVSSPMQRWMIDALASESVEARVGLVHVGWFTPMRLKRITLGPIGKQRLLDVDMVRSDQSLWTTIWNGFDIDHLELIRPQIHIWVDADGSKNYKFPGIGIGTMIDPHKHVSNAHNSITVCIS